MSISDWNFTEFEDMNWNVFTKSNDHIVPHRADEFSTDHNHKKPRYEVHNYVGMNVTSKYSTTKPVIHGNYDTYYHPPMQHTSTSNFLVPSLCDLKKSVKTKFIDNNSVSYNVPKSLILESTQKSSSTQFDWPDLSNFEDIDKMFGGWDSISDQLQTASGNELPWFSSSTDNYDSYVPQSIGSDNNSEMEDAGNREKVNSFLHLHYAIHQMDVITKICIRDSLYRMARSASTRCDYNKSTINKQGDKVSEKSNRSAEFMNMETNTNLIDRSIADLLFHNPVDSYMA